MTNQHSIWKSRDITVPTKVLWVKATVCPLGMYEREKWTTKKAENRRTDAWKLCCLRTLLRLPWLQRDKTSPSKKKSVLDAYWKDGYWRWNSNHVETWWTKWQIWKDPDVGKDWGRKRRQQMMRPKDRNNKTKDITLKKIWEYAKDTEDCRMAVHGVAKRGTLRTT